MLRLLKSLFSPTLRALRRSLIELSKFDAVHYETVCEQIEKTRYAIMAMEGSPIDEGAQAEFLELHREKTRLTKKVQRLENRRRFLLEDIEKISAENLAESEK